MLLNIFKISVFLCISCIASAERQLQVVTTLSNENTHQVNVAPFVKVGQKLYFFGPEKLNWFQAQLMCGSLGGSLASIENAGEMKLLSDFMSSMYQAQRDRWWWLSGSDLHQEGNFSWYGNSKPFSYTNWSGGQPDNNGGNENCVHLWPQNTGYQMNDWACNQQAYYICEAKNPTTITLTLF